MTNYSLPKNELIAKRYAPVKMLSGGMGVVYFCLDRAQDDFPVALKTFKPELLSDQEIRDRFLREATVWIELGYHPNIVQAYRVEYVQEDKGIYIVLQLIPEAPGKDDPSLRTWITPNLPMRLDRALKITVGIVRGMRHASTTIPNLVHRDLKPENILVGADEIARITDFGLATVVNPMNNPKLLISGSPKPRLTQGAIGTPLYMSPEQWRGESLDPGTDIYSMGCILLELISGEKAVTGYTIADLRNSHLNGEPLSKLNSSPIPTQIKSFLSLCLDPDRDQRFASWQAVEQAISDVYQATCGTMPERVLTPIDVSRQGRIQLSGSYLAIGSSYVDIGQIKRGVEYFKNALHIATQEDLPLLIGASRANLGVAHAELGEFEAAIYEYDQAIEIYLSKGAYELAANNHGNKGNAFFGIFDLDNAENCIAEALKLSDKINDVYGKALWMGNLANIRAARGDFKSAYNLFSEALDISRQIRDRSGECTGLSGLALVHERTGNAIEAIKLLKEALAIAKEIGDVKGEGIIHQSLGNSYFNLGELENAIIFFSNGLEVAENSGNLALKTRSLGNLGTVNIARGKMELAIIQLRKAINLAGELGLSDILARSNWSLGILYELIGDTNSAIEYLGQGVEMYKKLGMYEYDDALTHLEDVKRRIYPQ